MYLPDIFCEKNRAIIKTLIADNPLGVLVSVKDGVPQANHLPFFLDEQNGYYQLISHVAKANPACDYLDGQEVLVIFTGVQGYISPNWYPSKHIHHRHVPTYNYQVVHMRGVARLLDDKKSLVRAVGELTKRQEQSQPKPWAIKDAPKAYIDELLKHIMALQIDVADIQAKSKLSQNRNKVDLQGVIAGLTDDDKFGDKLALVQSMTVANLDKLGES